MVDLIQFHWWDYNGVSQPFGVSSFPPPSFYQFVWLLGVGVIDCRHSTGQGKTISPTLTYPLPLRATPRTDDAWLEAVKHLDDLRTAGLVREVALTNFNTAMTRRIIEEGGCAVVANQVSFSLVDRRPLVWRKPAARSTSTRGVG